MASSTSTSTSSQVYMTRLLLVTLLLMQIAVYLATSNPLHGHLGHPEASLTNSGDSVDKTKLCEVLCKKCPAEGGKVCNCDTYALRGDVKEQFDMDTVI